MQWNLHISHIDGTSANQSDLELKGNGLTLVVALPEPQAGRWQSYSVALDASAGWRVDTIGGGTATNTQIQGVLSNLTSLHIRGEFASVIDTDYLDNVRLSGRATAVPEPGALPLLACFCSMGCGVFLRNRRRLSRD